jgi:hypothetical protein
LCSVVDEVVEGSSYSGRAGAHLGPVGGVVHGVGVLEDLAGLGDEFGVPNEAPPSSFPQFSGAGVMRR